jgi:hypothetical protein
MDRKAIDVTARRWRLMPAVGVLAMLVIGCEDATPPTGPTTGLNEGDIVLLEGSTIWTTNSVSWVNRNLQGVTPENEFGFIAISQEAATGGPSHFFFTAPVNLSCDDAECFPGRGLGWSDANLLIEHLDWSPAGALLTFQGRRRSGSPTGNRIFLMTPSGTNLRDPVGGAMPSFSSDGTRVIHVDSGKTSVRWFNSSGSGGGELIGGLRNVEHPRSSPGDSLLVFSAADLADRGQRIFVWDTRLPGTFPQPVSDPDEQTRDGIADNHPTWSPNATYVAYRSTVINGNELKPAIFITRVGERTGAGAITRVFSFQPGQQLSYLRWHPSGRLMLFVLDNNVYMAVLPERFWDL